MRFDTTHPNYKEQSQVAQQSQQKGKTRDAWTGGIEWDRFFNIRTFLFVVLLVYLFYLFLKYVMPLVKENFGKK